MLFLLMNKDTKWLLFDCYEDEFGFVAGKEIEWYTESRPIGYDNIGDFLDARKAPKHRKHIAELLKKYGCESIENFLKLTHALSLNDTFWVKQPESTLSWNDVSLYRNEFDELVSNAAFDGVISSTTLSSTSPEFGTDGAYAKCWQRENGTAYLYKSGSDTYEIEPLSEYLATQVADILCRNNAKYELTFYHGRLASKCKLFTSERFGLVKLSALPVSNRRNPAAFLKFAEQYGSEDLMRRMFVLDALILNIDSIWGMLGSFSTTIRCKLLEWLLCMTTTAACCSNSIQKPLKRTRRGAYQSASRGLAGISSRRHRRCLPMICVRN